MTEPVTIIGEHMRIAGNLTGNEDLSVFGHVEGSIELTESLLVESTGVVRAEVKVRSAIISGVVVGNIVAEDLVEITADGRMVGDITAPRVILTDGAAFKGRIEMANVEADEPRAQTDARATRPGRDRAPAPRAYAPPATRGAPARPPARPVEPRRPARPAPAAATQTTTATATVTVTEAEEVLEDTTDDPIDTSAELLSVDAFREMGWNKCRSYIKAHDINLEYSGFDELVDAYGEFLAAR